MAFSVIGSAACDEPSNFVDAEQIAIATEPDQFSTAIALPDVASSALRPVHAHLLRDGRVLLIGIDGNAGVLTPSSGTSPVLLAPVAAPVEVTHAKGDRFEVWETLFCSGHTQLADGSFFSVGGTRRLIDYDHAVEPWEYILGLSYGTRFDGGTWTRTTARMTVLGPNAADITQEALRWYPQATRLADGRVLVTSGYEMPLFGPLDRAIMPGAHNVSAELYDPVTRTFSTLSGLDPQTPAALFNADYTHVFVLPYPRTLTGNIDGYAFGESAEPVLFGIGLPGTWSVLPDRRPGNATIADPNDGASSVMLPIRLAPQTWGYANGAALVAGGAIATPNERSIDVYDVVDEEWLPRIDMETRRHYPSTVLLPDGRVLVIAGHDDSMTSGARIRRATYVDPALGFRLTEGQAEMAEVRGYHTVALLLPDGRVLIGGGRDGGSNAPPTDQEKASFRYYSPAYMTRPRPALTQLAGRPPDAASEIGYGASVPIQFAGAVSEAVLIGLGSMTHSFDSNQRYIQLALTNVTPGGAMVVGPPNPETAPPGYYMLFLVDANRTPSVASIVRIR